MTKQRLKARAQRLGLAALLTAFLFMGIQGGIFYASGGQTENIKWCLDMGRDAPFYGCLHVSRTLVYLNLLWVLISLFFVVAGEKIMITWRRVVVWVNAGN